MQTITRFPYYRHDPFEQFFSTLGSSVVSKRQTSWQPATDITELDTAYKLTIDVPGMSAADIDISIEKNVLSITGERNSAEAQPSERDADDNNNTQVNLVPYRQERRNGKFVRRFTLPESVDGDEITADVQHGVLTVVIPKVVHTVRKITVNG